MTKPGNEPDRRSPVEQPEDRATELIGIALCVIAVTTVLALPWLAKRCDVTLEGSAALTSAVVAAIAAVLFFLALRLQRRELLQTQKALKAQVRETQQLVEESKQQRAFLEREALAREVTAFLSEWERHRVDLDLAGDGLSMYLGNTAVRDEAEKNAQGYSSTRIGDERSSLTTTPLVALVLGARFDASFKDIQKPTVQFAHLWLGLLSDAHALLAWLLDLADRLVPFPDLALRLRTFVLVDEPNVRKLADAAYHFSNHVEPPGELDTALQRLTDRAHQWFLGPRAEKARG